MARVYAVLDLCGQRIGDVAEKKIKAMRECGDVKHAGRLAVQLLVPLSDRILAEIVPLESVKTETDTQKSDESKYRRGIRSARPDVELIQRCVFDSNKRVTEARDVWRKLDEKSSPMQRRAGL